METTWWIITGALALLFLAETAVVIIAVHKARQAGRLLAEAVAAIDKVLVAEASRQRHDQIMAMQAAEKRARDRATMRD